MKLRRIIAALFAAAGLAAAIAGVSVSFRYKNALPILLTPPEEAQHQVTALMDAVCRADYETASKSIVGNPNLGVDRDAADEVGILIWDAFAQSMSYELVGECTDTEDGLAQEVTFTCMDITSVTSVLKERSRALLEKRVAQAKDTSEVYDENNDYREAFVMDVLYTATKEALKQDAKEQTVELTLQLSYQDGTWWVVADEKLLDAISGGILY